MLFQNIVMNNSFLVTASCANDDIYGKQTNKVNITMFTTFGSTKVLKCTVSQQSTYYTWENGKTIAQQEKINTKIQHSNKFSINRTLQEYNLKITNISIADGGKYCCEQIYQIYVQYCIQLCIIGNCKLDFFFCDDCFSYYFIPRFLLVGFFIFCFGRDMFYRKSFFSIERESILQSSFHLL